MKNSRLHSQTFLSSVLPRNIDIFYDDSQLCNIEHNLHTIIDTLYLQSEILVGDRLVSVTHQIFIDV